MRKRPLLFDLLKKIFHSSYGTENLKVQLRLSNKNARHLFPLDDIEAQLCLPAADVNFKNSKRNFWFSKAKFYSVTSDLFNDLENFQKVRAAKYETFVEFLEV